MIVLTNDEGKVGLDAAWTCLTDGRPALDAVEVGARTAEADTRVRTVGRGGDPDLLGAVSCDAAIMEGATRQAGAVSALTGYLHAVSVAREVMKRLPHVLLTGEGAVRFAAEIEAEPTSLLTETSHARYERWLGRHLRQDDRPRWPDVPLEPYAWAAATDLTAGGTVVYLALDDDGHLAAATSTSGWAYRYPGRVGDSPVVGAGLYADDRAGACACTHTGEMTIRAGTARSVVASLKAGASVREACQEAMADLNELEGGYVGPVVVHAIDRHGEVCVLGNRDLRGRAYYCLRSDSIPEGVEALPELMP